MGKIRRGMLACLAGAIIVPGLYAQDASAGAETLFRDDFSMARGRYEVVGPSAWKVAGGRFRFASAQDGFAVVNLDELDRARIETTLAVDKRLASHWVMAGPALFLDSENHWRLLLVAGPDNQRYFEFVERYRGVHQAQTTPPTRLAARQEGDLKEWQYGRPYRLIVTVRPESISGEIRDPANGRFWRRSFSLAGAKAIRSGRPGLAATGVEASFRGFLVEGDLPAGHEALAVKSGPAGSAVIVRDESGRMAAGLEPLFGGAGFGVTVVSWDQLERAKVPAATVDLLVLADARRLPAALVRPIESFLRARGKLVAFGAPAFGELLLKGPKGFVDAGHYADAFFAALARRPIKIEPSAWRRGARDPRRAAAIRAEGQGWQVRMDFDGWDNFGQPITGAFSKDNGLLCFTARGDARTPQLSVEIVERDGSRWIATAGLSTELRRYVLRPGDFAHWHDSKSGRGWPGDRFRPAEATRMLIGLSQSHTPQCKNGEHSFWFGDLSTAADPAGEETDVRVPEIEALSPSYKLYPVDDVAAIVPAHPSMPGGRLALAMKALCPVGRESGIGFQRNRPLRWVRLLDAYDAQGRNRGAVMWLTLGQTQFPGAMWLGVGLTDPAGLLAETAGAAALRQSLVAAAKLMAQGTLLDEAGARYFSYSRGEAVDLGGRVLNAGRREQELAVRVSADEAGGRRVLERVVKLRVPAGEQGCFSLAWDPPEAAAFPLALKIELFEATGGKVVDGISHPVDLLPDGPAGPGEFVTVEGSQFKVGGKPWYMLGMNYRPSNQGGRNTLDIFDRGTYDPVVIERDLAWMESIGINMLSAIHAPQPDSADEPGAYRDVQDFLNRCRRHRMKVFYFLPLANPLAGGDVEKVKRHIAAAGIKHHPAILAWELSWEPIYYAGTAGRKMDFLTPDWNAWIAERYGSLADAEQNWGFQLDRLPQQAAPPRHEWLVAHGSWDRAVAAYRRFFSDRVGRAYGDMIRELRRFDPNHLVTFRFGACGIPDKARFAHAHSAAVAKHVSFLCPEGYNLQSGGWATPTPADDLRKGGLVTLYYRFLSREKPVVWMEFGYTVSGFHKDWQTGMERVSPAELAVQRTEFDNFYRMFAESGSRGASPWWLPGGYRLGERSDFGVIEPDGSERPACQVLRDYLPRFAAIGDRSCVAEGPVTGPSAGMIHLDFDAHYADAWERYSAEYLAAVRSGRLPKLGTEGTGTTSADCPLVAVGNTRLTGHNPPKFLNAEFEKVEIQQSPRAAWREVRPGEVLSIARGAEVRCRAVVGNTAEAAWIAGGKGDLGTVSLKCSVEPSAATAESPISEPTAYLADAEVEAFRVPLTSEASQTVTLEMLTRRKAEKGKPLAIPFGQKFRVSIRLLD